MPLTPSADAPTETELKQWDALNRLRSAITASGLSNSAFARQVLVRDPRSLRRWLAGGAIPEAVIAWLAVKPDTS